MKEFTVRFSPRANSHLAQIGSYLSKEAGQGSSKKFIGNLIADCKSLAIFPERGTLQQALGAGVRTCGWRRRVTIVFRVISQRSEVEILAIYYAGQDVSSTFKKEEI
ncbi:MAG: type II toxin-antitoxin system RelE/ParE family toxin [Acidobacteria bacterium]|nr:type II toxin-antitoxin system RelE/ParE family toxin [Acidobacteriota bacterium]